MKWGEIHLNLFGEMIFQKVALWFWVYQAGIEGTGETRMKSKKQMKQ